VQPRRGRSGRGSCTSARSNGAAARRGLASARFHSSLGWASTCGLLGGSPLRGAAARSAAFLVPEVVWPGVPHLGPSSAPPLPLAQPHLAHLHPLVQARAAPRPPAARAPCLGRQAGRDGRRAGAQGRGDESGSSSEDHTSFEQPAAVYEGECSAAARSPRTRPWLPLGLDAFDMGAPGASDRLLQQWEAHLFAPGLGGGAPGAPGRPAAALFPHAPGRPGRPGGAPPPRPHHQDDPFLRELEARMPSLAAPGGDDPVLLGLGGGGRLPALLADPLPPAPPDAPALPGFAGGRAGDGGGLDARAYLCDLRAAEAPDAAGPVDVSELLRELRAQELPYAAAAAQAVVAGDEPAAGGPAAGAAAAAANAQPASVAPAPRFASPLPPPPLATGGAGRQGPAATAQQRPAGPPGSACAVSAEAAAGHPAAATAAGVGGGAPVSVGGEGAPG